METPEVLAISLAHWINLGCQSASKESQTSDGTFMYTESYLR